MDPNNFLASQKDPLGAGQIPSASTVAQLTSPIATPWILVPIFHEHIGPVLSPAQHSNTSFPSLGSSPLSQFLGGFPDLKPILNPDIAGFVFSPLVNPNKIGTPIPSIMELPMSMGLLGGIQELLFNSRTPPGNIELQHLASGVPNVYNDPLSQSLASFQTNFSSLLPIQFSPTQDQIPKAPKPLTPTANGIPGILEGSILPTRRIHPHPYSFYQSEMARLKKSRKCPCWSYLSDEEQQHWIELFEKNNAESLQLIKEGKAQKAPSRREFREMKRVARQEKRH